MKKIILLLALAFIIAGGLNAQENKKTEGKKHPRIEKAIFHLKDAIAYMEAAPHDFGGNKVAAIADCKKAIESLNKALEFRAKQDNKGKHHDNDNDKDKNKNKQHENMGKDAKHPRLEKAINEIKDAIAYMEAAPDDFGGNKAAAIADSKKAIESLNKAKAFDKN